MPRRPALTLEALTRLARQGRFGRQGVAPAGQVFLVVADSVMKQLDGLKVRVSFVPGCQESSKVGGTRWAERKRWCVVAAAQSLPNARVAIRSFLSEGLEECGPAGLDFLTVRGAAPHRPPCSPSSLLAQEQRAHPCSPQPCECRTWVVAQVLGAHEGEGLALSAGALGAAGSRSPFVSSKGQAVDYRIVEVALFFMREVLSSTSSQPGGDGDPAGGPEPLPVLLLSNDNAQIAVAKSHGLPAFRLSGEGPQAAALLQALSSAPPPPPPPPPAQQGGGATPPPPRRAPAPIALTSRLLRGLLGPASTAGLGSAAPSVPLQQSFDEAVAALHATAGALRGAQAALAVVADAARGALLAAEGQAGAREALELIWSALRVGQVGGGGEEGEEEREGTLADSLAGLVAALQGPLGAWDARVRSHEQPSRVLKWALPGGWGSA